MKDAGPDPRAVRSRALLRDALMALVAERSFASLTIQDVTRQAGLHRTTFYLHYAGLHELLADCARALFDQIRAEITRLLEAQRGAVELEPFVEVVFRHLEQHEKFYRAMLGKQGDPYFQELFQALLSELIFEPIAATPDRADSDRLAMTFRFFSAGFAGIAAWWLEKGKPISSQQASAQIARDILPGYLRLMRSDL